MLPDRFTARGAAMGAAVGWLGVAPAAEPAKAKENVPVIRAIEGLRFENADTTAQPHNLVVVRPGTREVVLAAALALGGDGPARGYVPAVPEVVAASRLLEAGEEEELRISVPDKVGVYPLVCTFPGHGVIMFGALYAGVEMPPRVEDDPQVPKRPAPPSIDPDPRPFVRRIFLPGSGPAAIAAALPGSLNLCWDAGPCRLRYVWRGGFLGAERHFESKGQALAQLGGPVVMTAPSTFPVRVGGREPKKVSFRGYAIERGMPVFEYVVDGQIVKECFSADNDVLIRRFQVSGMTGSLEILTSLGSFSAPISSCGTIADGRLRLTAEEAREVTLRYRVPSTPGQPPPVPQ